jgi:hypothetical protein
MTKMLAVRAASLSPSVAVQGSLPLNVMAHHPSPKLAISNLLHPLDKDQRKGDHNTERLQRRYVTPLLLSLPSWSLVVVVAWKHW